MIRQRLKPLARGVVLGEGHAEDLVGRRRARPRRRSACSPTSACPDRSTWACPSRPRIRRPCPCRACGRRRRGRPSPRRPAGSSRRWPRPARRSPATGPERLTGFGTGLPSSATTWKPWPGSARLRISPALPLSTWNSTRSPGLDPDRLALAQHLAVDREEIVADLEPLRRAAGERGLHRRFAGGLERRIGGGRREEVHGHVAAPAEAGHELLQCQEHLTVVGAGIVLRLDVNRPHLAAVEAPAPGRRRR